MTPEQIVSTLEKWQKDGMTKTRGVFLNYFCPCPRSEGFLLDAKLHVDGRSTSKEGDVKIYAYGTLSECIEQVLKSIGEEKDLLIEALREE